MKKIPSSFEGLRARPEFTEGTNGGGVEIVGDFPFMPSGVEAFLGLRSRFIMICRASLDMLESRHRDGYHEQFIHV